MYIIQSIVSDELIGTISMQYGRQLWAAAKLTKKHKNDKCAVCNGPVGDIAFRPITNASNRMHRICLKHLDEKPSKITDKQILEWYKNKTKKYKRR